MLKNAYLLAKIGADTAENEQHFAELLPSGVHARCCEEDLQIPPFTTKPAARTVPWMAPRTWKLAMLGSKVCNILQSLNWISQILQIVGGLILGCIEADVCK